MPRKISMVTKKQWLAEYDEGKPQISIANEHKRDVRTIKKGIEDARRERDITFARAELLKEALRKHNSDLMSLLEQLMIVLQPLPMSQSIPWQKFDEGSLTFSGGKAQYEIEFYPKVMNVTLDIESETRWQLLLEHLRHDPLPKALNTWRKTLSSHIEARMNVKQELAKLLKSKTGYQLENKFMGDRCILASAVDNLFFYSFINLPRLADIDSLVNNIVADSNTGQVKYGEGTTLAMARGEEEICKNKIIVALKELRETETMGTLISTYETHRASTGKASKAVEEICMMGLIPGQCRICQRLGM
jgi:hypothetical protein